MKTLIRGGRVYDRAGDIHRPPLRDVIVVEDRILRVVEPSTEGASDIARAASIGVPDARVIDATGKLVIPGLVNAHYHSYDVLSKGRFEDMAFDVWALHSQPAYWGKRSKAELRARTVLGALEALRHGITTIQDMNSLVPQDEETLDTILAAYDEVGIRVVFSIAVRDLAALDIEPFLPPGIPPDVVALIHGKPGDAKADLAFIRAQLSRRNPLPPRLTWAIGPSGPQRCSTELLEGLAEISADFDLPVLTHTYETRAQLAKARKVYGRFGGSYVRYLREIGLLTHRTTLAHGVYLSRPEIDELAEAGAGVVHNPLANLKLKNGTAPLIDFKRAGINLALGCDNCSCSDCQNLFQAMKMYALLAQGMDGEPSGVFACDAIDAATIGGARAVGLSGQVGEVKAGMKADLALIDLSDYAYQPFNSAARQMVYSETGRGVDTVMVDGEIVMSGGKPTKLDFDNFRGELTEIMAKVDADYESIAQRSAPAVPYLLEAARNVNRAPLGLNRYAGGGLSDPDRTAS
ncbi:amidohydrolase family protein [Pseudorhodoplanes sp.]|uniref:amidohydrolase family protein n=1 Tax=Pseudorhodoplanes sp. TaxID=1934341 RepID=UPI002BC7CCF5|nr:amidohydrolase family protein [Pseudorhodoplanes sp.]HWV42536.1 amidohydrolase family protein [Pseudorhodoplanes sp.]